MPTPPLPFDLTPPEVCSEESSGTQKLKAEIEAEFVKHFQAERQGGARDLETTQDVLKEILKNRNHREICSFLHIGRGTLHHWIKTLDRNFERLRSDRVLRVLDLALDSGITKNTLPEHAQALLATREQRVFLCHSSADKKRVRSLYSRLRQDRQNPWLDEVDVQPGQDWRSEIDRAIRESVVVVICLSNSSVTKTGFVQKEVRIALDAAQERPEGDIFVIPARLEVCEVPSTLSDYQWLNLFKPWGYRRLLQTIENVRETIAHRQEKRSVRRAAT